MATEYKYFMVHNPNNRQPNKQHQDKKEAIEEAKRLAKLHTGERFFILEAVECYSVVMPEPEKISVEYAPVAV